MTITGKKNPLEAANGGLNHSKRPKLDETNGSTRDDNELEQKSAKAINDYQGFSFQDPSNTPKVDVVSTSDMSGPSFFDQYISQRKPCVLDALPRLEETSKQQQQQQQQRKNPKTIQITKALLEQVAGDQTIQVERRQHVDENFGQNRSASRQIVLTISDFLRRMTGRPTEKEASALQETNKDKDNDDEGALLYWSTQEDTDDPFNVPCRQLVDRQLIQAQVPLAGNLILSSCNLWMGKTTKTTKSTTTNNPEGASSGLHHDYHDNFYLLLRGRKRFRLFSPDCAPQLATYGTIDRIHSNGRVSYVGNETRADGVPLESLRESPSEEEDDEDEEEEELVLGKGFDYVSDDSDGDDFDEDNQKDDFDEIMGLEDTNNESGKGGGDDKKNDKTASSLTSTTKDDNDEQDEHPDSFSRINPCRTDRDALTKEFPSLASCKEVTVEIQAGQMLYLPAGWFHEVTSYSNKNESANEEDSLADCHMALNYWYHPPDAPNNYKNPYKDDFWKKEEEQRLGKS